MSASSPSDRLAPAGQNPAQTPAQNPAQHPAAGPALVAGIDSSTQSCKVVIREADTGRLVRQGRASHPDGTEVYPEEWWKALQTAITEAGGLADVSAVSVGGQQHGMVVLDAAGQVIRPALLWNDTRSADAATQLIDKLGGPGAWAEATGTVLVASITITKLRWLAQAEPENAARIAAIALPHDYLTWRLQGSGRLEDLATDRSDASGTGYFDAQSGEYRRDLLSLALGRDASSIILPRVFAPGQAVGRVGGTGSADSVGGTGALLGPGAGDNAGAALALGMVAGDVTVSLGTSGVVSAVAAAPTRDPLGHVTGFADATGNYLPLVCTLNASRTMDAACQILGVDYDRLGELALQAAPGAGGLTLVPYLEGERTPNFPDATGSILGLTLDNATPANIARAAIEGMLCSMADGLEALRGQGVPISRVRLIGGGARSEAVCQIAPAVLGLDVQVPPVGEYVADGAARQAAWVLSGLAQPPAWHLGDTVTYTATPTPEVLTAYRARHQLFAPRP